jgi:hypothetical protein
MSGMVRPILPLALAAALLALPGCVRRVPTHSPRIAPTEDHLSARSSAECLACHDAPSLPGDHSAGDRCIQCHKICKGRF